MPRALITGVGGQDGSLLAELLLQRGYEVVGTTHSAIDGPLTNFAAVQGQVELLHADLLAADSLRDAIERARPDELYHLAAPTFVPAAWTDPGSAFMAIAGATAVLLEAAARAPQPVRVLVASSSEVFGDCGESPQRESTPMRPRGPYGVAKLAALHLVRVWREERGMHASAAITYNHESERRPERFLPRKVTMAAAAIAKGEQDELVLGDLDVRRDWSAARDVVRGEWLMLQQDEPGDYVLASGVSRTVGELVAAAFSAAGVEEEGRVRSDPGFVRAPETTVAQGDPSLARERLGWEPEIGFDELIAAMVRHDLAS